MSRVVAATVPLTLVCGRGLQSQALQYAEAGCCCTFERTAERERERERIEGNGVRVKDKRKERQSGRVRERQRGREKVRKRVDL